MYIFVSIFLAVVYKNYRTHLKVCMSFFGGYSVVRQQDLFLISFEAILLKFLVNAGKRKIGKRYFNFKILDKHYLAVQDTKY